jgi:L-ascorbate metabolism protein UlaG (beta-lactamase superfamily)
MNEPLTIRYLGQEGFLFRDATKTLVIDPYLSDSVDRLDGFPPGFWRRAYPPPVRPEELTAANLVLVSHDHLDHADPETLRGIAAAAPGCRFAGPRRSVALLREIGLAAERTFVLNAEQPFRWEGVTIEPVAAAHEDYETDADGFHRFLGFLLRWNGATLYHAGDTIATPQLSRRLERERIDVGFLPVNGGDDARRKLDVVGNMDVVAAAALAAQHRFGIVVPMHYDLYPNNGLTSEKFDATWAAQPGARDLTLEVFRPGEAWTWGKA